MAKEKPYGVILGLGGANALGVTRSLGEEDIPIAGFHLGSRRPDAHHSKYMDSADFVESQNELVQSLITFGKNQYEKGVVFPTGDDYLLFCSRNENLLSPYFHLPSTPLGSLESLIDKGANLEIGRLAGFEVPMSGSLVDYVLGTSNPVIVKPLNSIVGGKKDMVMYSSGFELLKHKKSILERNPDMIVQEFIPGDNQSLVEVHAYNSSRGPIISGMQRNEVGIEVAPSVYLGVIFRSIWDDSLVKPSLDLASKLDFNGALDINLKKSSSDGKYYFMEVNLRTSANLSLDTGAGVNLPATIYYDLIGENFNGSLPLREIGAGWIHEPRIKRFFDQMGSREKLMKYLENICSGVYFDSKDMAPFDNLEIARDLDTEIHDLIKKKLSQ